MKKFSFLLFLVGSLAMSRSVSAQVYTSGKALEEYLAVLKEKNIDSILILRSGCVGCARYYDSTSQSVDKGEQIYVLTKDSGKQQMVYIDRWIYRKAKVETSSLFRLVQLYQKTLQTKEKFYQRETSTSSVPFRIPYHFETLEIMLPGFTYSLEIRENHFDHLGNRINTQTWYRYARAIIARFYDILQAIPPEPEA